MINKSTKVLKLYETFCGNFANDGNMGLSEHAISNIKVFMSNAFFCSAIMSAFVSNAMTNEPLNEG